MSKQKGADPSQSTMDMYAEGGRTNGRGEVKAVEQFDATNPKQKAMTEAIIMNLIIGCSLPISIVENVHFREFLKIVEPSYQPIARSTIATSKMMKVEAGIKRNIIQNLSEVCDCVNYLSILRI